MFGSSQGEGILTVPCDNQFVGNNLLINYGLSVGDRFLLLAALRQDHCAWLDICLGIGHSQEHVSFQLEGRTVSGWA
jgi:hypothetical protein